LALDDGLSEVEWLRAMWCETMDRDSSIYNSTIFGNSQTAVVIRQAPNPKETALATDARATSDHIMRRSGSASLLRKVLFLAVYGVGAEAIQELMKMAELRREDQAGDKMKTHRNREQMKQGSSSN
jgi:hypothetical protein